MLQRGSPYLEDVNWAINLAREIGLVDAQFRNGQLLQFCRVNFCSSYNDLVLIMILLTPTWHSITATCKTEIRDLNKHQ